MTTREFANLVLQSLEDQGYFKEGEVAHPADIASAFSAVGETIGTTMSWAISAQHSASIEEKKAMMQAENLQKTFTQDSGAGTATENLGYSEWKIRDNKEYL